MLTARLKKAKRKRVFLQRIIDDLILYIEGRKDPVNETDYKKAMRWQNSNLDNRLHPLFPVNLHHETSLRLPLGSLAVAKGEGSYLVKDHPSQWGEREFAEQRIRGIPDSQAGRRCQPSELTE